MTDGEKGLGVLIALLGAAMGQSVTAQYGVRGDASPKHVLENEDVKRILELEGKKTRLIDAGKLPYSTVCPRGRCDGTVIGRI